MWTDTAGPQPHPEPQAMSAEDVRAAIEEFASAARNAREAGFDAVELHGANGYLLEQFLNPHTNRRTDAYGGDVQRRARFVVEAVDAAAAAIGRDRVAIRLSPYNTFNDLPVYDETEAQYLELARALRGVLYVHLVQSRHDGFAATAEGIRRGTGWPGGDQPLIQGVGDHGNVRVVGPQALGQGLGGHQQTVRRRQQAQQGCGLSGAGPVRAPGEGR